MKRQLYTAQTDALASQLQAVKWTKVASNFCLDTMGLICHDDGPQATQHHSLAVILEGIAL